jgi:hypothetical protein
MWTGLNFYCSSNLQSVNYLERKLSTFSSEHTLQHADSHTKLKYRSWQRRIQMENSRYLKSAFAKRAVGERLPRSYNCV